MTFLRVSMLVMVISFSVLSGCARQLDLAKIVARNIAYALARPVQPPAARLKVPFESNSLHVGMIGHSTVLVSWDGFVLLTDPNLSSRIKVARRVVGIPLEPEEIQKLDLILISHAHYDHLDLPTLKRLPKHSTLVVPSGCRPLVQDLGFVNIHELGWDESVEVAGVRVEGFRPAHWGKRNPWSEEMGYNSYLITRGGKSILFAGDTGYTDIFKKRGEGRSIDLAFLPISAYRPDWFRRNHASPEDALKIFLESGARFMIPIHWGTFILSHEPLEEPIERLQAEAARLQITERVIILRPGETFRVPEDEWDADERRING